MSDRDEPTCLPPFGLEIWDFRDCKGETLGVRSGEPHSYHTSNRDAVRQKASPRRVKGQNEKERALPTDNKSIVRRMYEEVWNKRNLEAAKELIAPSHAVQLFDMADSGVGPEAYARNVVQFVRAFPDLKFTVIDMVGENEKVVALWNISGTHRGEFRGIAPTGKKISVDGITINQLADGKIIDSYVSVDMWSMMQQLGAVPAPTQAEKSSAR